MFKLSFKYSAFVLCILIGGTNDGLPCVFFLQQEASLFLSLDRYCSIQIAKREHLKGTGEKVEQYVNFIWIWVLFL